MLSLWECLCEIKDPRRAAGRRFSLPSILSFLVAGMLCGKLSIRAIARWGKRLSGEQLELIGITRGLSDPTPKNYAIEKLRNLA